MINDVTADIFNNNGKVLPPPGAPSLGIMKLNVHATAIHPIVPHTRIFPNFLLSAGAWWNVMAFISGTDGFMAPWNAAHAKSAG
jgi:hypothetical protein